MDALIHVQRVVIEGDKGGGRDDDEPKKTPRHAPRRVHQAQVDAQARGLQLRDHQHPAFWLMFCETEYKIFSKDSLLE